MRRVLMGMTALMEPLALPAHRAMLALRVREQLVLRVLLAVMERTVPQV